MGKYSISLELAQRKVVVVGGGAVAARKADTLAQAQARVVVIAPDICQQLRKTAEQGRVEIIQTRYSADVLKGAVLVIAATDDRNVNERVFNDSRAAGVLCNVVDVPELCDFFVPAVITRGSLQIAVSTDGKCPAYSAWLRQKLEQMFTDQHGRFLDALDDFRQWLGENVDHIDQRGMILKDLVGADSFDYFIKKGPQAWRRRAENIVGKYV